MHGWLVVGENGCSRRPCIAVVNEPTSNSGSPCLSKHNLLYKRIYREICVENIKKK